MERHTPPETIAKIFLELWWVKALGGLLVFVYGPWREQYSILLTLFFLDLITGVVAALKEHRLSSAIAGQKTALKATTYAVVLAVANLADRAMGVELLAPYAIIALIFTEAVSILENLVKLDEGRTPILREILERVRLRLDQESKEGKKKNG